MFELRSYSLGVLICVLSLIPTAETVDYKEEMRNFVRSISQYGKARKSPFFVIPQNGIEIVTVNGDENGAVATTYVSAIDGVGQEDLFYGINNDDQATPIRDQNYLLKFLDKAKANGLQVLVIDYATTRSKVQDSYQKSQNKGYISFAAKRDLNTIPSFPTTPWNVNQLNVSSLRDAKNFLYLINPDKWNNKNAFLQALRNTDYDIVLIDLYFQDSQSPLLAVDVESLKRKKNGGKRLVISYMSIGEAENYRNYWQSQWKTNPPAWMEKENPDWKGNFKVRYWMPEWQAIITGNENSYLQKIINAGFDGVYLDIIDAFEYFENNQ